MRLSRIVKSGAILIAEVDLKTHTRWIRDADPLNIYRYSGSIYDMFRFRGSPNRFRPFEYEEALRKYGWAKIRILPLTVIEQGYLSGILGGLDSNFKDRVNQMEYLTMMICATKE